MNKSIVELREKDADFWKSSNKDERERWILDRYLESLRIKVLCLKKRESPDFIVDSEPIEITEVQRPGRYRHHEYKMTVCAAKQGGAPLLHEGMDLSTIQESAAAWIIEAVEKKSVPKASGWTLVVYVNLSFCDHIDWERVEREIENRGLVFRSVACVYMLGDGAHSRIVFKQ